MELTWSGSPATRKMHLLYMLTFFLLEVEKDMAAHSSILAWEIAWTEGPGRLESRGSQESETT